jgi:hypothetical protein
MVNAFSFCLYGRYNPRYYTTLIENIKIALQYFPDWKVWIHVAPDVDPAYINTLRSYSNTVISLTGITGPANMILRFYTIDDPSVDVMFVRDADSLIHSKDRWAIQRFMESPQFVAHAIRDHHEHAARMLGGLWGIRKSAGLNIQQQYQAFLLNPRDMGIAHDQSFLCAHIYPLVRGRILIHYSNDRLLSDETGEAFPFPWSKDMFCGRIEVPNKPTARFVGGRIVTTRAP